jgi:hypothetical protein
VEYLAWPLCISVMLLILGLVFIFRYSKEIGRLIDRIKSIGKSGMATVDTSELATKQGEEVVQAAAAEPSAVSKVLQIFDNQLLVEQENLITSWLNGQNINDPTERERVLTRYLASVNLTSRFEAVYNSIFGTQLRALETLNITAPGGVPLAAVEVWYETGRANYPVMYKNGAYTFQEWVDYLHAMMLVTTVGTQVKITLFGREFLKHLVDIGHSMDKNG